jgi:Fic family protein
MHIIFLMSRKNTFDENTIAEILQYLHFHPDSLRSDIETNLTGSPSSATVKRMLAGAIKDNIVVVNGKSRASKYSITPKAHLLMTFDVEDYFKKEIDERIVQTSFNFDLIDTLLPSVELFSDSEQNELSHLQDTFTANIAKLSQDEYNKEMERLGIDLSWKSSQIEGNTYSLLETERLLKEREEAKGKTKEEALMLLNHKAALRFVLDTPDYLKSLSVSAIEDIHSLLVKDLNVKRNIRSGRVGITGTNYRPLDNDFQIKEAMQSACKLINSRKNIFEKALLALLLISYIQPFADGNKRTARIISNALLIANKSCPLSFRTVDSVDYKKAMLVFYEQNNLSAFKRIFIEQFKFAVETYF